MRVLWGAVIGAGAAGSGVVCAKAPAEADAIIAADSTGNDPVSFHEILLGSEKIRDTHNCAVGRMRPSRQSTYFLYRAKLNIVCLFSLQLFCAMQNKGVWRPRRRILTEKTRTVEKVSGQRRTGCRRSAGLHRQAATIGHLPSGRRCHRTARAGVAIIEAGTGVGKTLAYLISGPRAGGNGSEDHHLDAHAGAAVSTGRTRTSRSSQSLWEKPIPAGGRERARQLSLPCRITTPRRATFGASAMPSSHRLARWSKNQRRRRCRGA